MTLNLPADDGLINDLVTYSGRRVMGLLGTMVQTRGQVLLAIERGTTMSAVAATLAEQNRSASVMARENDGTLWSITFGPAEHPETFSASEAAGA